MHGTCGGSELQKCECADVFACVFHRCLIKDSWMVACVWVYVCVHVHISMYRLWGRVEGYRYVHTVRFSTTAKKALPRNADFICGNQKRTANPHKCTFSCGIGRDFHITLKLVGGAHTAYEHICLVLPTSVSGTTQLARLEISGGPPCETHGIASTHLL